MIDLKENHIDRQIKTVYCMTEIKFDNITRTLLCTVQ